MMAKKAAQKTPRPCKMPKERYVEAQFDAALCAAIAHWCVTSSPDNHLFAVNPDDSSEVWTWCTRELIWKRKGEEPTRLLRVL